jgi:hypothetical protein
MAGVGAHGLAVSGSEGATVDGDAAAPPTGNELGKRPKEAYRIAGSIDGIPHMLLVSYGGDVRQRSKARPRGVAGHAATTLPYL